MIHLITLSLLLAVVHFGCQAAMIEPKYSVKKTIAIYSAATVIFVFLIAFTQMAFYKNPIAAVAASYIATGIECFIVFILTSSDALGKKVFLFTSYSNIYCIFVCFAIIFCDVLFPNFSTLQGFYFKLFLIILFSAIMEFIYIKRIRPFIRAIPGSNQKTWSFITLISILFLIVLSYLAIICHADYRFNEYIFILIMTILIYTAIMRVSFTMVIYMKESSRKKMVGLNIEYLQSQLEQAMKNEVIEKRIRHDYRHHSSIVISMLERGEVKEALEYVNKYRDNLELTKPQIFCNNVTVNAILSNFSSRAESEGITFSAIADTPEDPSVDSLDIVAVLSNLLENAFNGCAECGAGGEVKIKIKAVGDKTTIKCSNTCKRNIEIKNDMLVKKSIGIESILSSIEKYDGHIKYEKRDGVLTAYIILRA